MADKNIDPKLADSVLKVCSTSVAGLFPQEIVKLVPGLELKELVNVANSLTKQGKLRVVRVDDKILFKIPENPINNSSNNTSNSNKNKSIVIKNTSNTAITNKNEYAIFKRIEQGGENGVKINQIRDCIKLTLPTIKKLLKALETRGNIKSYTPVNTNNINANDKIYIATSVTPNTEITGGNLYNNMNIDVEYTQYLMNELTAFLTKKYVTDTPNSDDILADLYHGVASLHEIYEYLKTLPKIKNPFTMGETQSIIDSLLFREEIAIIYMNKDDLSDIKYKIKKNAELTVGIGLSMTPCYHCPSMVNVRCILRGRDNPLNCPRLKMWTNYTID